MPTGKDQKGKIYFKAKDDDKYKELGVGTIEIDVKIDFGHESVEML